MDSIWQFLISCWRYPRFSFGPGATCVLHYSAWTAEFVHWASFPCQHSFAYFLSSYYVAKHTANIHKRDRHPGLCNCHGTQVGKGVIPCRFRVQQLLVALIPAMVQGDECLGEWPQSVLVSAHPGGRRAHSR